MSLMSMRRKMASKKVITVTLWIIIAVFLLGVVLWSVPGKNMSSRQQSTIIGGDEVIATVGESEITAEEMERAYQQWKESAGQSAGIEEILPQRQQIYTSLIERHLVMEAMKKLGVRDHNGQFHKYANESVDMLLAGLQESAETQAKRAKEAAKTKKEKAELQSAEQLMNGMLAYYMQMLGGAPTETVTKDIFARWYANDYLLNPDKPDQDFLQQARQRLIGAKLIKALPVNPLTEAFVKQINTKEVKARWIFIAAKGEQADADAQASKKAEALRAELLKSPKSFAEKAKATSTHVSASNGGDLGWIQGGQGSPLLPLRAEYLAYTTKPGAISPVIRTINQSFTGVEVGYAFLMVEEERERKDAEHKDYDWAKEKEQAMLAAAQRFEAGFGREAVEELRAQIKTVAIGAEVASYQAQMDGDLKSAAEYEQKIIGGGQDKGPGIAEVQAAVAYKVAQQTTDVNTRIRLLEVAENGAGSSFSKVALELGRAYAAANRKDEALVQFGYAENGAQTDTALRESLKKEYAKLGNAEGEKRMKEWLASHKEGTPANIPGLPQ